MRLQPLPEETIAGIGRAIEAQERTCASVVEACLTQIDEREPQIKAWVSVDRAAALARARELDEELAAGRRRGPLHGIPIGIKDLVDIAGCPTAAGAPWLVHAVAAVDAPIVERLRGAGAVILGKTVTTQFACFDPPPTRNPWNPERTPGGSSSGSAAAVASGMCLGAIGSQTGGSITRPAAFCGVAGCKPTFGIVPLKGVYPLSPSLDHGGPIARTVTDLALLLEVLVDPACSAAWSTAYSATGGTGPFRCASSVKLGRLRGPFDQKAEPAALTAFDAALDQLSRSGASVRDVALPAEFDEVPRCHRTVMTREIANHHRPFFAEHLPDYLPCIRGIVEEGLQVSEEEYARCRRHQQALTPAVVKAMREVDVLVLPAAAGPAPAPETTGDPSFNSPWSYTGMPTVSFPIALSAEGMPLAIQLVGRPHDEPGLFAAALWCERCIAGEAIEVPPRRRDLL